MAQVVTLDPAMVELGIGCRHPACMLPATKLVIEDASGYPFCDEHAGYYADLACDRGADSPPHIVAGRWCAHDSRSVELAAERRGERVTR